MSGGGGGGGSSEAMQTHLKSNLSNQEHLDLSLIQGVP